MESNLIFQSRIRMLKELICGGGEQFGGSWRPYLNELVKEGSIKIKLEYNNGDIRIEVINYNLLNTNEHTY